MNKPNLDKHFDRIPETLGCAGCWFFDSDNLEYCSAIIPDCKGIIYMPKMERILSTLAAIDRHIVYVDRRIRLGKRFNLKKKSHA